MTLQQEQIAVMILISQLKCYFLRVTFLDLLNHVPPLISQNTQLFPPISLIIMCNSLTCITLRALNSRDHVLFLMATDHCLSWCLAHNTHSIFTEQMKQNKIGIAQGTVLLCIAIYIFTFTILIFMSMYQICNGIATCFLHLKI